MKGNIHKSITADYNMYSWLAHFLFSGATLMKEQCKDFLVSSHFLYLYFSNTFVGGRETVWSKGYYMHKLFYTHSIIPPWIFLLVLHLLPLWHNHSSLSNTLLSLLWHPWTIQHHLNFMLSPKSASLHMLHQAFHITSWQLLLDTPVLLDKRLRGETRMSATSAHHLACWPTDSRRKPSRLTHTRKSNEESHCLIFHTSCPFFSVVVYTVWQSHSQDRYKFLFPLWKLAGLLQDNQGDWQQILWKVWL